MLREFLMKREIIARAIFFNGMHLITSHSLTIRVLVALRGSPEMTISVREILLVLIT